MVSKTITVKEEAYLAMISMQLTAFITKLENLSGITQVCPATVIQRLK